MEGPIKFSETSHFKAILPCNLNANNTLFGGEAMKWMDEVAFITATRFTRQHMFTVKSENIRFLKTIPPDSIIEIVGNIEKVRAAKLKIKVEIFVEKMYENERYKAIEGMIVFAALDQNKQPLRINIPGSGVL